jgi:carbonic anhydrase
VIDRQRGWPPARRAHRYHRGVSLDDLLRGNRQWAEDVVRRDPGFFTRLASQQSPRYLWIGCSDSRVPANEITGTDPGEVFVHRNVANVVVHSDLNCLSVLQYAVEVLRVDQVVVCGHLGCGGVLAALEGRRHGLIDNWLRHVQDVAHEHADLLGAVAGDELPDLLCRLNVVEQVTNVCRTTIVQEAWDRGQPLQVHGVVYGLDDGILSDLGVTTASAQEVDLRRAETVARLAAALR